MMVVVKMGRKGLMKKFVFFGGGGKESEGTYL